MTRRRTTIDSTSWLERPHGGLTSEEQRSHGRRATALVITALAILMMVVM
jgi:hypothetical protein